MKKLPAKKLAAPRSAPVQKPQVPMGVFLMFYGAPGEGKTTLAAEFESPLFIHTHDEQGIRVLNSRGLVPSDIQTEELEPLWDHIPRNTPHPGFLHCQQIIEGILAGSLYQDRKTIVFDTVSGLQAMVFQHCISLDYAGNGSADSEFYSYQKGYEIAASRYWEPLFLRNCIRLVDSGRNVLLLSHAVAVTVPNPTGPDYQEYRPSLQSSRNAVSILSSTQRCVHGIFYLTSVKEFEKADPSKRRSRTIVGAQERIIGTCPDTWFLAKNQFGLTDHLKQGSTPAESYSILKSRLKL